MEEIRLELIKNWFVRRRMLQGMMEVRLSGDGAMVVF